MLKISIHYLKWFQNYGHLTEKFWQLSAYSRTNWPILYGSRRAIVKIFQLNDHKSETAQDIDLKFSAFVHHMFGVNWHKNFSHCSISESVAPSSMQKLWTPLATIFVEKNFWKEFLIFWKKMVFWNFRNESGVQSQWSMTKVALSLLSLALPLPLLNIPKHYKAILSTA